MHKAAGEIQHSQSFYVPPGYLILSYITNITNIYADVSPTNVTESPIHYHCKKTLQKT